MKNKTISRIFFVLSVPCFLYFLIGQIDNPNLLNFFNNWLLLSAWFFIGSKKILARGADKKYVFLADTKKNLRILSAAFLTVLFVIIIFCLSKICTPDCVSLNTASSTDYVIVLGGGIRKNGELFNMPKKRVEVAAQYMKKHPMSKAVVSGGICKMLDIPEAPELSRELQRNGIDGSRILIESKARDTLENFDYSILMIAQDSGLSVDEVKEIPVTVVTSKFHMARSLRLAEMKGLTKVQGICAPVPLFYVVNSYTREICSYIKLRARIIIGRT